MHLAPGMKLGPYEILSPLGSGGMGEVYRARDTRLDRSVAIKILPAHFSNDPIRKQRFEREAKSISALNHPNICTLHDVGSENGVNYIVMECVEGESLAARLQKGALPIEQVLKIGHELADALNVAHRNGIIHRDLKPGNIMLTKAGAKLLDFGLARAAPPTASAATLTASVAQPLTQEGTIVGTFQYMSPEQVEGKELDARSDVFSLGAVLYEMVTGQRAFQGKTQLSVAGAILEKEPAPVSKVKPMSPQSLDHIIRRCLAKDPDDRWQTARDLALELKSIHTDDSSISAGGRSIGVLRRGNIYTLTAFFLVGILAASGMFLMVRSRSKALPSPEIMKTSILAPEGKEFDRWAGSAVSPDGKYIVFSPVSPGENWGQLYLRRIDSLSAKPLPGTDGTENPFWSPDSKWIGFVAGSKLRKVSVDGTSPLVICDSGAPLRGGSWSPNGTILFVPGSGVPVYSVPEAGGTPVAVTQLDKSAGELSHRWPVFLPGGKHYLFFSRGRENAIYASSIGSKERKLILKNDTNALYVSPGYLLFVQNGVLLAQPFDADHLELRGSAVAIADAVPVFGGQQHALFSASENGILAVHSEAEMLTRPMWVDLSGRSLEPLGGPAMYAFTGMRLSSDGRKVAFAITDPKDGADNIWVTDIASHQMTRLTFEKLFAHSPVWSPDGGQLLYTSNRLGTPQTFSISTGGVGEAQALLPSESSGRAESWSPDGRYVVFAQAAVDGTHEQKLRVLPLFGDKKPYPLLTASHSQQWSATFSPDGKWMAYASDESGEIEIYIVPFPDAHKKIQVSKDKGSGPHWSPNGRQLLYIGKNAVLTAATLHYGARGIEVSETRELFKLDIPEFEISGDGKRLLVFKVVENQEPSTVTLISNWTNLLPR